MIITWEQAEARMRDKIERMLKRGNGHGQISVRPLGRHPWRAKRNKYLVDFTQEIQQRAYALAAKLCEEYGGVVAHKKYLTRKGYDNAGRVYQF